jgi:hypothetical protein
MKSYRGYRAPEGAQIDVMTGDGDFALPYRFDLRNHSPDGFEWGYGGSGPAQTALAMLADCLGADIALTCYQPFKFDRIAGLPREWVMTEEQIRTWHAQYLAERAAEMEH